MADPAGKVPNQRFTTVQLNDDHSTTSFREHRATRMPMFADQPTDFDPHPVLDKLSVAIVAAGAVGFQVVHNVARLQVGRLAVIDPDTFSLANINTQGILPNDVGQPKAMVAAHRAKSISPTTHVQAFVGRLESLLDEELLGFDILIVSPDNLQAELEASRRCRSLGMPMLTAAVDGATLNAQIKCYSHASPASPCVACGYSETEWAFADAEKVLSCHPDAKAAERSAEIASQPTISIAGLSCLAADLATITLLRKVLGLGSPVADTYTEINSYMNEMVCLPLEANTHCPADHAIHHRCQVDGPITDASVNDLLSAAEANAHNTNSASSPSNQPLDNNATGGNGATGPCLTGEEKEVGHTSGAHEVPGALGTLGGSGMLGVKEKDFTQPTLAALGIDGHTFATHQYCMCDEPRELGRFVRDGELLPTCAACGAVPKVNPQDPAFVPIDLMADHWDRPLRELGVVGVKAVKMKLSGVVWWIEGSVTSAKPQVAEVPALVLEGVDA